LSALIKTATAFSNARLEDGDQPSGDPTEIAVLQAARALGGDVDADRRERSRRHEYNFDPPHDGDRAQLKTCSAAL
jgi:magnesium-transporting ATPase (P-type)